MTHLIRFRSKWCDYPGYELTAYCGKKNGYPNYDDKFHYQADYVDCPECQEKHGMELLQKL